MIWKLFKRKAKIPNDFAQKVDPQALEIVKDLQRGGHRAYLVGGCVRDLLLRIQPKDFDIATSANPFRVKMLIQRSQIIGKRFRIVVAKRRKILQGSKQMLFPPVDRNRFLHEFQITTFRRAPETALNGLLNENVFGTEKDDAERRDFTLNGLFLDPTSKKIVDYVGGESDIKNQLIRTIGDPYIRFEEDPVRILRAVRFQVRTGFKLEKTTELALKNKSACLLKAKKERTREEFLKMAKDGCLSAFIQKLHSYKLLEFISPCLAKHCNTHSTSFFQELDCFDRAIQKQYWPNQHLNAPFFFPLLFNANSQRVDLRPELGLLKDDILVSKAEWAYLETIQNTLNKALRNHKGPQKLFFLLKRNMETQAQFFFVLKLLSECSGHTYGQIWTQNEEFWRELKNKYYTRRPRPDSHR